MVDTFSRAQPGDPAAMRPDEGGGLNLAKFPRMAGNSL